MKNKVWILTIILIALGIVIMGISLAMVNFDIREFGNDDNYKKMTYEIDSNNIEKIVLKDVDRKVYIEESIDDKIHITYYNNDKIKEIYEIKVEKNTLKMYQKPQFLIMQLNPLEFIPVKNVDIIVQIPKNSNITIEK